MNSKGQFGLGLVWGIVGLLVTVMVFTAFLPTISNQFSEARSQDSLNCESTEYLCGQTANDTTTDGFYCYNSSRPHDNEIACTFMSISPGLIVIFVVIGAIGAMMAARAFAPAQPQYQEGY